MFKKILSIRPAAILLSIALLAGANYTLYAQKHGKGGDKHGGEKENKHRGDKGDKSDGDDHGNNRKYENRRDRNDDRSSEQPRYERRQLPQVVYNDQRRERDDRGERQGKRNKKENRDNDRRQNEYGNRQWQVPSYGGWVQAQQSRRQDVRDQKDERKAWKNEQKYERKLEKNAQKSERYRDRRYESVERRDRMRDQIANEQWWSNQLPIFINRQRNRQSRSVVYDRSYQENRNGDGRSYGVPYTNIYRQQVGQRNYGQNYYDNDPYGSEDGYANDNYGDNGGTSWKSTLLRSLIGAVLNGIGGGNNNDYSSYSDQQYSSRIPVNYDRTPSYGDASPYYGNYSPQYGQNDLGGGGSNLGGLLGALPIAELFGGGNDLGGFASNGLSQVLAQGYLQGLSAGDTARGYDSDERYYNDPYQTDGGYFDQGSSTIAENRRLLSEGYALGYQDALNGRGQSDQSSAGGLDLVNILLSNVLNLG